MDQTRPDRRFGSFGGLCAGLLSEGEFSKGFFVIEAMIIIVAVVIFMVNINHVLHFPAYHVHYPVVPLPMRSDQKTLHQARHRPLPRLLQRGPLSQGQKNFEAASKGDGG